MHAIVLITHLGQMWLLPNQHALNSGCTAEQLLYGQFTRPSSASTYTASDKALPAHKKGLAMGDYTVHLYY